ncbi:restriction endonuclease subunit S [Phaeodactylibacter sp.]|nr:restriction endonuclease subunit S [Phaeodactylibacter sp.]MCI5092937.1 restriction endonuclease subunit S [Phaeodactylibacter sp.]|tara:strand:+ start:284 stop:1675 length:1392 start_codon:yes stop_codon:yes gene_type:complete
MVMEVGTMQNINLIRFSELYNWSVSHLLGQDFEYNKNFPLVKIGKFLTKNNNVINLDNDTIYKRVTVSGNNGGVRLRNTEVGKNIGTKRQFIVESGQFILSKIDARNGAMGLVPEDLEGAIVTNDFPTYDVDTKAILPQFLLLITTTKKFIEFAQTCSSGTTNRQRIDLKKFLDVQIPLPPLNDADAIKQGLPTDITQEKLVAEYNQKIKEAEQAKQNAIEKEAEIETYLYKELGIQKAEKKEAKKGLHFVRFKDMERWDSEYLLTELIELNSDFPLVSYNNLFIDLYNGIPARHYSTEGVRFLKVADIRPNHISNHNIKHINSYKKTDLITENTLLITRKGTVGNSIFIKDNNKYTASSEVFIIKLDTQKVNGDYLSIINNSEFVQNQYREKNTGTIMPSISQNKLKEIKIPLPKSLEKQNDIVEKVSLIERTAKNYLDLSETLKTNAIKDFENIIFKTAVE